MTSVSTPQSRDQTIAARMLVTIGALLVYRLGLEIPLPGLDMRVAADFAGKRIPLDYFSLFALGVIPMLNALFVIEILKLVFPRLARWERTSPANSQTMNRVVAALALVSATLQGWGMAGAFASVSGLAPDAGPLFMPLVTATLIAATAVMIWLAALISSRGFGSGFWLLFSAPLLAKAPAMTAEAISYARIADINEKTLPAAALFLIVSAAALVVVGQRLRATMQGDRLGAIVWPPMIAVYGSLALLTLPRLLIGGPWFAPGGVTHLALTAVLILVVTFMRAAPVEAGARSGGSDPGLVIALVQIATCIGAALATKFLDLPFAFEAVSIIVVVATVHDFVASIASAQAPRA